MLMLIITLAALGFLVYLVTTYIPMPPIFKTVIYLLQVFGVADVPVPRVRE